jgi:zinc protease
MSMLDRTLPPGPASIRPFAFPRIMRSTLHNGLTVLSAQHGRLPVVTIQVVVDAGAAHENARKAGLAALTASALDTGTAHHTGEALAWEFERLGVELSAEATWDAVLIQATTPTARLEPTLTLVADIVRNATFPAEEVQRVRDEQLATILQRQKEPRALATDMAAHFIFGPDALYGRPLIGTAAHVRGLTREDVVAFHGAHFVPGAASLMLVGDIDDDSARELAEHYFGDWSGERVPTPSPAPSVPARPTTIFIVDRPDAVQSEIRVGHIGVARDHEEYFPLLVMNAIVGGAFTSRLNLSLREKHGFTYGVRSGFAFRRAPGPFVIQTAVATDVTVRAIEEILRELRALRADSASEEEVDSARRYLAGVLPLELQTTEQLAARLADVVVFGLPDDYFDAYPAHIASVSGDDVVRVAREQLKLEKLAIVIVGNAAAISEGLAAIGCGPVECHTVVE